MPLADAQTFADRIIALLGSEAKFFTNGEFAHAYDDEDNGIAWHSVTDATFNTGVVFVDGLHIGLFWVEDED